MAYLLDSDVVIDWLAEDRSARLLFARLAPDGLSISMVAYMEIFQGVVISPDELLARAKFDAFLEAAAVLAFSLEVAERCARLRADLQRRGKRIRSRPLDLLTAATALEHGLTLVTRNVADYQDIPDLSLYPLS